MFTIYSKKSVNYVIYCENNYRKCLKNSFSFKTKSTVENKKCEHEYIKCVNYKLN